MVPTANRNFLIFIFCLIFFDASLHGIAQNQILTRKITLNLENKRTEEILNELSRKGRFYFSYSSDLVQKNKVISIKGKNISVQEFIKQIFGDELVPVEIGKYIILKPNIKTEDDNSSGINTRKEGELYTITGYIIDASTGQRLSNATIYEVGKTNSVLTNIDGFYKLNISTKADNLGLVYSSHNFKDTVIVVQPANHSINMRLKPVEIAPEQIENKGLESLEVEKDSITQLEMLPLVKFAVNKRQFNLSKNLEFIEKQHFQISLIPKFGTNRLMSGNVENNVSLNILGGYSYAVKGIELGYFLNIVREDVVGFQASGFSNIVGGNTKGVQIAGFSNNNRKSIKGVQIAGFSNIVLDTISGIQVSGFSNVLKGKLKGLQLSGFSNVSTENVDGVQISGFNNFARKDVNFAQITGFANYGKNIGGAQLSGFFNKGHDVGGAQIAGFANFSNGTIKGLQVAGFINIAEKVKSAQIGGFANISAQEITGLQFAAFLNLANKVKGLQVGFINIADSVSGLSLGFLSIVLQGFHKPELSFDETKFGRLSIKTGTNHFYNIFSGGINLQNPDNWTIGYGAGTEFRTKRKFYLAFDLITSYIKEDFKEFEKTNILIKFETLFGWNLIKSSGFSIGPSFNLFISDWKDGEGNFLSTLPPYELFSHQDGFYKVCGWIGGVLTFRF